MRNLRTIVPAVATTLAVGVGGTAFALAGAGPATSAAPASSARSAVGGLLAGTYEADFSRLSVPAQQSIRGVRAPEVSGKARVGDTVRVSEGSWKPATVSISYTWYAGSKAIRGADGAAYAPAAGDVGKRLSVVVVATKRGYGSETVESSAGSVAPGELDATSKPRINGSARVGETLRVSNVGFSEKDVDVSYAWLNGRKVVSTSKRYTIARNLKGTKLQVEVTASKPGYRDASALSASTEKIRG